jgi:hypothetical protein
LIARRPGSGIRPVTTRHDPVAADWVQLDDTFAKLPDPSLGHVDVSHDHTAVVIRGQLGAPLLELLVGALK